MQDEVEVTNNNNDHYGIEKVEIDLDQEIEQKPSASRSSSVTRGSRNASFQPQVLTEEDVFEKTGGFGRFQFYSSLFIILAMGSGGFFFCSITFLELRPHFMCNNKDLNKYQTCEYTDVCHL